MICMGDLIATIAPLEFATGSGLAATVQKGCVDGRPRATNDFRAPASKEGSMFSECHRYSS